MNENFILAYYQQITDGTVTVGRWIREWYAYVVNCIEKGEFLFDQKKANRAVKFIERYCHHHEGAMAPGRIKLELWQKAMISVMFGCLDESGARQFREVFVVMGRKNGKTLLAAAISAYMTYMDGEYGARVYFCAPKLDQARLCYDAFYQMILKEPDMASGTRKRRTDIYVVDNNASAQPIAFSAKKSDGLNPHLTICDEVAAWQGDPGIKQYEVLKSALGARRQPMLLSISTAGYISDGIFDELMKRSTSVLLGTSKERRIAPFLYVIDDVEKWDDINELRKSNPNLGISVSVDYMLEEIAVAEGSLSKKAEFLTKYCNIKQNSSCAWLSTQTIRKGFGNNYRLEDFRGCYALAGIDLSQTTDLTACVLLIERGGTLYYFTKFYLPANVIDEASSRDGLPYRQYIQRGLLTVSGESFVDYSDCLSWFKSLIEQYEIYPLQVGIDRYCAQYLQKELEEYGFHCDTVFQGTNLTGVINTAEGMLKDGMLQCADDNDLMKVHLMDAALKTEAETNRKKLIKLNKNAHVDGVAALLDALCMRQVYWEQYGAQLRNEG